MSQDQDPIIRQLEAASNGLRFQSEADYPVEPLEMEIPDDQPLTPQLVLKATNHRPRTPVEEITLARFFEPATKEQDWHNEEERETVRRYQSLVKLLEQNLTGIKVFKVGKVESDVYVVGRTRTGTLAGVKTKVVET